MKYMNNDGILSPLGRMALLVLVLIGGLATLRAEQTAPQLLAAVNAKIKQAGGITAGFSMSTDGQTVNGTLKTDGSKFALSTPVASTWYDGKSMWTYNQRSNETTLISPTPAELSEANPLLLISSRLSLFTATYAKNHPAGLKTVVLTPKRKDTGMKSIHVTINPKTSLPTKMVAVPSSGRPVTITLSSVKTAQSHPASTFTYPKSKYPKTTVVDLR